jgi:hypothetical protein
MVSKERFLAFLAAKRRAQWEASLGAAVVWSLMLDFARGLVLCLFWGFFVWKAHVEGCDRLTARGSLC